MKNRNVTIILIAIVAVVVIMVLWAVRLQANFVALEENVSAKWSDVENVYQRRLDLIPNLVSTVKGYADFEKETLTAVVDARAKATSMQVSPDNLDPAQMAEFMNNQNGLSSALGRLMVVVERYPDLKANQNFMDLQAQLEGTENRISVERKKFNDATRAYNTAVRQFPKSMIASMFGFEKKPYFEATEGAEQAPAVEF